LILCLLVEALEVVPRIVRSRHFNNNPLTTTVNSYLDTIVKLEVGRFEAKEGTVF
jgi:hypothetical protein